MDHRPSSFDGYRVGQMVAAGAIARVYLAESEKQPGRRVVIKVFEKLPLDQYSVKSTEQLMDQLRSLDHPGIVSLVEVVERDGSWAVVMDYVEGRPLREAMSQGGLTVKQAMRLVSGISGAVAALHHHGIVHGDIKPENIILTPDQSPVLVDLPLPVSSEGGRYFIGTPRYAAAEVLEGTARPTASSDVYSLGLMLLELLTRQTEVGLLAAALHERVSPEVDHAVRRLIAAMTSRSPHDRPSAAESAAICADLAVAAPDVILKAPERTEAGPIAQQYSTAFRLLQYSGHQEDPSDGFDDVNRFLEARTRSRERRQILLISLATAASAITAALQTADLVPIRVSWGLGISVGTGLLIGVVWLFARWRYQRGLLGSVLKAHASLAIAYAEALEGSLLNPDVEKRLAHGGYATSMVMSVSTPISLDVDDWPTDSTSWGIDEI